MPGEGATLMLEGTSARKFLTNQYPLICSKLTNFIAYELMKLKTVF